MNKTSILIIGIVVIVIIIGIVISLFVLMKKSPASDNVKKCPTIDDALNGKYNGKWKTKYDISIEPPLGTETIIDSTTDANIKTAIENAKTPSIKEFNELFPDKTLWVINGNTYSYTDIPPVIFMYENGKYITTQTLPLPATMISDNVSRIVFFKATMEPLVC